MKSVKNIFRTCRRGIPLLAAWITLQAAPSVPGAAPREFTVESPADGKIFKLSDARGKYVALHFLLKTECPFCLRHTRDYATKTATTPTVTHVFLKPDSADEIKAWSDKANRGEDFPGVVIYRDADARVAEQFGIPDGYSFHGQTVHFPALVLIDPMGREIFRHVGKSNTDRYSFEQLSAKLTELNEQPVAALAHYNLGADKLALSGYDSVGYLVQNKALKGRSELSARYHGVTYYFATEENQKRFLAEPARYQPTYGGWCATAMAKGEKVEIDPTNFKVTNGRLFLFFKAFYANAIKDWNKDEANLTTKADANWKKVSGE